MPRTIFIKRRLSSALLLAALPLLSLAESPFLRAGAGGGAERTADASHPVLELGPRMVTVSPGSNAVLEVAIDHLNRIVTPFSRPSVRTVSGVSTEVDGSVLYVATASDAPATLYITDADDARTTIGLTIAPRRVPPREIRLVVPGVKPLQATALGTTDATLAAPLSVESAHSGHWRQPQPYLAELTQALRTLALGDVPAGYIARRPRASDAVACPTPGLKAKTEQVLDGGALTLMRVSLRNTGGASLSIDETTCRVRAGSGSGAIAALALWPLSQLPAGAETGLLLALHQEGEGQGAGDTAARTATGFTGQRD
jgi:conjugal transfer pilus assembly protein TraK